MIQGEIGLLLKLQLQSEGYLLSDNLDPVEANTFLNKHTDDFIDEVLSGLRSAGGSFETNVVRSEELRLLIARSGEISAEPTKVVNETKFKLPGEYRNFIRVRPQVNAECLEEPSYRKARVIMEDILDELLDDTYHKSSIGSPIATIEGEYIIVHLNGFTTSKLKLSYIKKPVKFDLEGKANEEYPLTNTAINRIIDKTAIELMKVLEQDQQKIQSLQQNKLL